MKKTIFLAGAALVMLTASVKAQTSTDTVPKQQPAVTTTSTETAPASKDKYNNWSADTYKLQPMPEALSKEKIFPVLGKYELTDKEGTAATVTVTADETNKGLVWIEGLPQGKLKASLRRSPATYKIPAQKIGEEADAKEVAEGVLIYDKDANVLNVCIGCTYNMEDPAVAFTQPAEPVVEETEKKVAKTKTKANKNATAKVEKVKPVVYTGTKVIEATASAQ